jgi:hypothetical protein
MLSTLEINMGWYLMIKKVKQNGFSYLCKCTDKKDHISYKGSGVFWKKVLNQHPEYIIDTEVLGYYKSKEELRDAGSYYSQLYNIVESKQWANCIPEIGDGGSTTNGKFGIHNPITFEEKFIKSDDMIPLGWIKGRKPKGPRPAEITEKIVAAQKGQKRSEEIKERMKNATRKKRKTISCSNCGKQITLQNIKRHMEKTHGKIS